MTTGKRHFADGFQQLTRYTDLHNVVAVRSVTLSISIPHSRREPVRSMLRLTCRSCILASCLEFLVGHARVSELGSGDGPHRPEAWQAGYGAERELERAEPGDLP